MAARVWRSGRALVAAGGLLAAGGGLAWAVAGAGGGTPPAGGAELAAAKGPAPAPGATITVTGSGQVSALSNTLTLQIGATTRQATATAALDDNDAKVARLEAALVAAGVRKSDMQTSNLQLSADTDGRGVVIGYTASDELTLTTHELARAGRFIDAAAHAVGNDVRIDGIEFGRSDTSTLLRAARVAAMRDAATEAAQLAAAAGVRLGGIVKVTDEEPQAPITFPMAAAGTAASSPVPLRPGTTSVSAQVRVVYALTS